MRALSSIIMMALTVLLVLGLVACKPQRSASDKSSGAKRVSETSNSGTRSSSISESGPSTIRSYAPLDRVVVTRDTQKLPSGCGLRQAAGLMTHFLDAYNKDNQDQLRRLFPDRAELQTWLYSMNRGRKPEVSVDNRKDLLNYFANRHGHHDRMRLLSIMATPSSRSSNSQPRVGIVYSLSRRAGDLEKGSAGLGWSTIGKSVIDCKRQEILLTSMDTSPVKPGDNFASNNQCPEPADRNHNNVIIACTGR